MWYIVALICLLSLYAFVVEPRWLKVQRYREELRPNPTTKLRIVFLSDFHAGGGIPNGWWERITLEVNALAPDAIVLAGDFVVHHANTVKLLQPFKELRAPQGVYFVLGNHDHLDRPQDIRAFFVGLGFMDLTNRTIQLKREGKELDLQGIDDHWYGAPQQITRTSKDIAHLTIAHEPDIALDLEEGKTDLVLSGHTHGGQVCLPIIGAPWIPAKLKQKVIGGRKLFHGIPLIVSRGLGQEVWHPRFGARPEVVVVDVGI
ncbi:MAG: metallophosphoesterase [Patescibacteria group bacterium]